MALGTVLQVVQDATVMVRSSIDRVLVAPAGDSGVPTAYIDPTTSRSYDCSSQATIPFTDIHPTDSFCRNVCYVWALGIVDGTGDGSTFSPNGNLLRSQMAKFLDNAFHLTIDGLPAAGPSAGAYARDFVYSPEMNLLEESSISTFGGNPSPSGSYDYIWFNGHPIAEENGGTHWTFTDHLGTPILQTNGSGNVFWRPEYEPYGRIWALRTADQHEALRFPGQEAEELNISGDGNGSSERSYNIFRWYRPKWGRYTQADPIGLSGGPALFSYALENPVSAVDRMGLAVSLYCGPVGAGGGGLAQFAGGLGYKHCFVRVQCDCPKYDYKLEVTARNNSTSTAVIPPPQPFAFGHGGSVVPLFPADNDSRNCRRENCILARFNFLRNSGYPYPALGFATGPNSNTFANDLLTSCGTIWISWPPGTTPFSYYPAKAPSWSPF